MDLQREHRRDIPSSGLTSERTWILSSSLTMARAVGVVVLALFVAAAAASDVLDLTEATFDSSLAAADVALVEFFAPCAFCGEHNSHWVHAQKGREEGEQSGLSP